MYYKNDNGTQLINASFKPGADCTSTQNPKGLKLPDMRKKVGPVALA